MNNTDAKPFSLSVDSITKWQHLSVKMDTLEAANELYSAFKNPAQQQFLTPDAIPALELITPTVLQISDSLFGQVLTAFTTSDHIEKKTRKIARLSHQLLRSLCLTWFNSLSKHDLTDAEKRSVQYNALQLVGISMRRNAQMSERPSDLLWQKMGKLYRDIHTDGLTNTPVTASNPFYNKHPSIDSVIKRNLLYGLINFYRFSPKRLAYCYEIADLCADKLELIKNDDASFNFYWNLTDATLPSREILTRDQSNYLCFNTKMAADYLSKTYTQEERKGVEFDYIESTLNGYQSIIDSVIPTKPMLYQLAIGLKAIHSHLKKVRRISNINRLSAELPDLSRPQAFELEPLEHERKLIHSLTPDISTPHKETASETVSLQFAQDPAYCLIHIKRTPADVNQPVLLIDHTHKALFGVIRKILNKAPNSTRPVLVEVLPYHLLPITVSFQGTRIEATVLQSASNHDCLLLPTGKYSCGEKMTLISETEKDYYLHKLIEANEYFMLYQLDSD